VTASSSKPHKIMPFSLVLPRNELHALRRIAGKEDVSVAAVVRRAILTAVDRAHPEFREQVVETEAETFFEQLAGRFPAAMLANAKRRAFKWNLLRALG
jgi:hypothetical protein